MWDVQELFLLQTIDVNTVQACNSHEVMCWFYEWLSSLLSALWLSQAHCWNTSSFLLFALALPRLSFKCLSVYLRCFCISVFYDLSSHFLKLNSGFHSINLQFWAAFSPLTFLFCCSLLLFFVSVSPLPMLSLFWLFCLFLTLGNIFLCLLLLCLFFAVVVTFFPVFIPSSHLSFCVFPLLKQREQWTWCQIMQISSRVIWKQRVILFL